MKSIKQNDTGRPVFTLKMMLRKMGHAVTNTDIFDDDTTKAVKQFQTDNGLGSDGQVGPKTWAALFTKGYTFQIADKDKFLKPDEYFPEYKPKNTIYLHHTAGAHRPDFTIDWWEGDNQPGKLLRVATAFVIGRRSVGGDSRFDGVTYRAFPEYFWAHHLGLKKNHNNTTPEINDALNAASIGIEICSFGPLQKRASGAYYFLNRSNNEETDVPRSEVCILRQPWRGHKYFQKYTDQQIAECKRLILTLAYLFDIPIPKRTYNRKWFDINEQAYNGTPGIWTHTNVRPDKTDCFPQPEFIAMLNSLHKDAKTFVPTEKELVRQGGFVPTQENDTEDIKYYSGDLD